MGEETAETSTQTEQPAEKKKRRFNASLVEAAKGAGLDALARAVFDDRFP